MINKTATSDRPPLTSWQLGFQWHRRGVELVFKSLDCFTKRLFHTATIFCCNICICCLKLHQADHKVEELQPSSSTNGIFRLSVCLSVTPFWLCSHHRIIMKFSGVITNDKSKVHAKGQGQRSKVKVTEVTSQLNRFRTVTPVWIHRLWNDAQSLK